MLIIKKQKLYSILLYIYIFLAVFQLPLVKVGNDSIGVYDLYTILYFLILFALTNGIPLPNKEKWNIYFLIFLLYIIYMFSHLIFLFNVRSFLIVLKYIEFLFGIYLIHINVQTLQISLSWISLTLKKIIFFMVIFQIISWFENKLNIIPGFSAGFGFGNWYRVGLPFKTGVSSNPAGFVLATYLFYYIYNSYDFKILKKDKVYYPLLILLALFLTVSRTNFLAMMVAYSISLIPRVIKSRKYRIFVIITFLFAIITVMILVRVIPEGDEFWKLLKILVNPRSVFEDQSFMERFGMLWVAQIKAWLESFSTIFYGKGLNYFAIADTTYTGLLANQGIIGFLMFMFLWYGFFLSYRKNYYFSVFLILVLINGLNAETLVLSYRAVQIYIIVLYLAFSDYNFGKEKIMRNSWEN